MEPTPVQFLGVGSPLVDLLGMVSEDFLGGHVHGAKGGMELIDGPQLHALASALHVDTVMTPGGSAANTIYGLAMLGESTGFVGKIADDDRGRFYRHRFEKEQIDCSRFKYSNHSHTGTCISLVTPDSERTMRTHLGAAADLHESDLADVDFRGCRHVHLEGYLLFSPGLAEAVLAHAKAAGAVISLDLASFEVVGAFRDRIANLLETYVDMVFANETEAEAFCGSRDPDKGIAALSRHCPLVAIKHGPDGAWIHRDGLTVHAPANRVAAVDTTGAGDLWASGFLHAHYRGLSAEACGRAGALLGAEVVQVLGARIPTNKWPQLRGLIATL